MDIARVSSGVRRVTILQRDKSGDITAVTVYQRKPSKKKGTGLLKPVERLTRRVADAQSAAAKDYLARHERSNAKKKDGWAQDLGVNVFRASQKGTKALKLERLFEF
jgi:hypothetical protein